jgi:hypothetical protein
MPPDLTVERQEGAGSVRDREDRQNDEKQEEDDAEYQADRTPLQ